LIVGRFLDEKKIQSIENITQLSITLLPLASHSPPNSQRVFTLITGTPIYVQSKNSSFILGYATMNDVVGLPVLIMEIGSDRSIYNQGMLLIQNLILSLCIILIVFILLIIIVFDRFVTSRLTSLSNSVSNITQSRDLTKKLQVKGNDEIANLEKKIDSMLASLHKAWTMKSVAESNLRKKIDELERFKGITIDREMKMIELKKQLHELQGKSGERI
jgi:signal transduction histidine kinase